MVREACDMWMEGARFTHERYTADRGKFVGHTPAVLYRAAEMVVLDTLPALLATAETADQTVALLREALPHLLAWRSGELIDRIEAFLATLSGAPTS